MRSNLVIPVLYFVLSVLPNYNTRANVSIEISEENDEYFEFKQDQVDMETVNIWAHHIGKELWMIGKRVTNLNTIQQRYIEMKASVEVTDGNEILNTIITRMNRLIKEKVDAVLRIKNAAMKAENSFVSLKEEKDHVSYRNSKFSNIMNHDVTQNYEMPENKHQYTEMELTPEPHFYNVMVNTSYSSVHVPTNIYDRWDRVIEPIYWSEQLDEAFKSNYETDPSLMWQYYASTYGFLRHYPAFHWVMYPDKYDCRTRIWYIQAATCSKEVVVLIDNSGTMYGMRNTIAQLTTDSLLKTFSNNDYINIFRLYNESVLCLVPCFNDTLIQATPENIELFRSALYKMCPEKKVNFLVGFSKAFTMLHDFLQNKTEQAERRNQAVFLLTDMLPSDSEFLEIRNEYERIYNDTNIQVELFIYFIGKDIPDVREVQWEKCLKNGSIVHVRTMDEVPEDALKYLSVIARSQNESTENYPISWTHVFFDIMKDKGGASTDKQPDEEVEDIIPHEEYGRLSESHILTSVSAPVYSSKSNKKFEKSKKEEMIGVAAIDVPISDFEKLTMPHKIGVNGYAFIVTNNGYLLFHPDLRPVKDGTLRENFNSVDLTEVEFYDDNENDSRKPHKRIYELRKRMVNQEIGNMSEVAVKFHYDDQKRIGSESRNYFFAPLKCSPFTLGLALPRGYGNYWVKTTKEIEKSRMQNENYKDYFQGNWRIHPKWSYCNFRDKEKYKYTNPKDRLMKFFEIIFDDSHNFTWVEEHRMEEKNNLTYTDSFDSCFTNDTMEKPSQNYFCDKELMELLFFDAKLTQYEFAENISEKDVKLINDNRVRVRFVATQSGLTRWQDFSEDIDTEKNFGDKHDKALDEVWYKSAVLLHQLKSQNFVFSLPKDETYKNKTEKFITASYAVFHSEGGNEAPGVVVGFQISYETIKIIINKISACNKTHWDCYIIDANGYVIYSEKDQHIGNFFGIVEGAVMEQMVTNNIFRKISMFDYQAFEEENKVESPIGASSILSNPLNHVIWLINWAVSKIILLLIEINIWQFRPTYGASSCSSVTFTSTSTICSTCKADNKTCPLCCKAPKQYSDACQTREVPPHIENNYETNRKPKKVPADKKYFLYLYTNLSAYGYSLEKSTTNENCSRPFFAKRISYTNALLILVDSSHESCYKTLTVDQEVIKYDSIYKDIPACNKKMINSYPRKKLRGCSDKILQKRTREKCASKSSFQSSRYMHNYNILLLLLFSKIIIAYFIIC